MNAESGQQSRGKESKKEEKREEEKLAEHRGRGKSKALESLLHDDDDDDDDEDGRVIETAMLISNFALTSFISYTVVTDETHRHTDTKTE